MELYSLDRLVVAVVEELGVGVDSPLTWVGNRFLVESLVIGDFMDVAVLARLVDGFLAPPASVQVVGGLLLAVREQVVADGRELKTGATLEHEHGEVVRDVQKALVVGSCLLGYFLEHFAAMAHLHHAKPCAVVVHQGFLGFGQHGLWHHAWASGKIVYCLLRVLFDHLSFFLSL